MGKLAAAASVLTTPNVSEKRRQAHMSEVAETSGSTVRLSERDKVHVLQIARKESQLILVATTSAQEQICNQSSGLDHTPGAEQVGQPQVGDGAEVTTVDARRASGADRAQGGAPGGSNLEDEVLALEDDLYEMQAAQVWEETGEGHGNPKCGRRPDACNRCLEFYPGSPVASAKVSKSPFRIDKHNERATGLRLGDGVGGAGRAWLARPGALAAGASLGKPAGRGGVRGEQRAAGYGAGDAGPGGGAALADRAMLRGSQRRGRVGPLRGAPVAKLVSPRHPVVARALLPGRAAAGGGGKIRT